MVATRVHRSPGPNPETIYEKNRPGEFLVSIYHEAYCHENVVVEGGVAGVAHNTVVADANGDLVGIVYEGVPAGKSAQRAVLARGPAEVSLSRLVFPSAPDGADVGSDNVAETAALKTALLADLKAAGIVVRN